MPSGPLTFASGVTGAPFVGLRPDGTALVVAGGQSFELSNGSFGLAENFPAGVAIGLHIDQAGDAAVLTASGSGSGFQYALLRKTPVGTWSAPVMIAGTFGVPLSATLVGNERGDLMVHATVGHTSPTYVADLIYWSSSAAPLSWQQLILPPSYVWYGLRSTLDGDGRVATLRAHSGFVMADRQDPNTAVIETFTLAHSTTYLSARGLGTSSDGTLRAIWQEIGGTTQRRIAPGGAVDPTTAVPVFVPVGEKWLTASNGAVVGWIDTSVFRSGAGSNDWRSETLVTEPLAVAISTRGEALFAYFRLPDELWLVRWRPGEEIDPPLLLINVPSPFAALRDVALAVDDGGRVVLIFRQETPGNLTGVFVE